MISYKPLWDTMDQKNITTYAMIHKHGIPSSTMHSLKHGGNITMLTLEKLCNILNCTPDQIVKFKPETTEQT